MEGNMAAINGAIEALKNKGLVLKIVNGLQDSLSCKIKFSKDKKEGLVRTAPSNENMEKKFGELVQVTRLPVCISYQLLHPWSRARRFLQKTNKIISWV